MPSLLGGYRRLRAASIWATGGTSAEDRRANRLRRRTIFEFYVATWAFGSFGVLGGVPALRQTFGEEYAAVVGFLLASLSIAAFIGAAFPARWWRIEFYSVSMLSGLILLYALAVLWAGVQEGDAGRAAVSAAIAAMSALPRWRVTDLPRQRKVHAWR